MSYLAVWKKYSLLFAVCAFFGILAGSLLKSSYFDALKAVTDNFIDYVINRFLYIGCAEKIALLVKIVFKRMGPFILLWLLSLTIARIPYIIWLCAKSGFTTGFFICFMAMAYRAAAIKYIAMWYFPQIIIYAAVYGFSMIYITENLQKKKRLLIAFLSLVLFAGCILEAYVNPICLSYVFS